MSLGLSPEIRSFLTALNNLVRQSEELEVGIDRAKVSSRYYSLSKDLRAGEHAPVFLMLAALSETAMSPCTIVPPPADILIEVDADTRNLRLRCKHSPSHCWDFGGRFKNC